MHCRINQAKITGNHKYPHISTNHQLSQLLPNIFAIRAVQRKQKEIKGLKNSLEKLTRENERLGQKLEAAWLESSLGARVVKAEVVSEDTERRKDDRMGQDEEDTRGYKEGKDKQPVKTEDEAEVENEGLDTSRSEGR